MPTSAQHHKSPTPAAAIGELVLSPPAAPISLTVQTPTTGAQTVKPGDLVLLKDPSNSKKQVRVLLVHHLTAPATVHTWEPEFLLMQHPGTWSLFGDVVEYTPPNYLDYDGPEQPESIIFSEENPKPSQPIEFRWDTGYDIAEPWTLDITFPLDKPDVMVKVIINPSGKEVFNEYWHGQCPNGNCCGAEFCPGCGGISGIWPELFMSCGIPLACPTCLGWDFAYEDMRTLKNLYMLQHADSPEYTKEFKARDAFLNQRRVEMGFPEVEYNDYDSTDDEEEGDNESEGASNNDYVSTDDEEDDDNESEGASNNELEGEKCAEDNHGNKEITADAESK